MEPFQLQEQPIPHLVIKSWQKLVPGLNVGFSTKKGGVSKGFYATMNLALHVNDQEEDVISNRKMLTNALGFSFDAWTSAEQVHGNHIEIISKEKRGKGRLSREDAIQDTDGMVTNEPNILLTSFYADCVPLFFLDPVKKVIGLAHAGWKGTQLKIAEKMIETFVFAFGSNREDIHVAIGPSIGQCCYEVDGKVIQPIQSTFSFIPEDIIFDKNNGHYDLDLKKLNQQILIHAGILPNHIEVSSYCTSCDHHLFFSHRKDKGKTGRMAAWIGLRKDES
ncbi:peptidoglycan editing factor PgeF [Tepidibacillus sp. LV47]|uniref:peptidoglycan editing factor PgeF n=1 Tax=Tepidibacillus sp. LV47 TaxID=3398228 RepID=UPI003AAFDE5C